MDANPALDPHDADSSHQQVLHLVQRLGLQPHPEGGWYREIHRSAEDQSVRPDDGRGQRAGLTSIDFLLGPGQHSAWHRVQSDEAWHLLDGGPLQLWLVDPALTQLQRVTLAAAAGGGSPRHVVPAHWWQAAAPLPGRHAYVGATVGPGFDFQDFSFGRADPALVAALSQRWPEARWLLD